MFVFLKSNKRKERTKMAEKTYPMTKAEKEQLEKELEELKLVRRPEVVERIKIARSYGDLSENSEYDAAKDEVAIGKTVVVQEVGTTDKDTYHIVGSAGADIFSGKISNESPIAQALIGKKKGDIADIVSPATTYQVEIISVDKTK